MDLSPRDPDDPPDPGGDEPITVPADRATPPTSAHALVAMHGIGCLATLSALVLRGRLSPLHFRDETETLSSYQKYGEETRPDKMNDEHIKGLPIC